jgi:hypothetical protein
VVADLHEALRQDMKEEASKELVGPTTTRQNAKLPRSGLVQCSLGALLQAYRKRRGGCGPD